jgi:hypothetical protein
MNGMFISLTVKIMSSVAATPRILPLILIGSVNLRSLARRQLLAMLTATPTWIRTIKFAFSPETNGTFIPVTTAMTKNTNRSLRTDDNIAFQWAVKKLPFIVFLLAIFSFFQPRICGDPLLLFASSFHAFPNIL